MKSTSVVHSTGQSWAPAWQYTSSLAHLPTQFLLGHSHERSLAPVILIHFDSQIAQWNTSPVFVCLHFGCIPVKNYSRTVKCRTVHVRNSHFVSYSFPNPKLSFWLVHSIWVVPLMYPRHCMTSSWIAVIASPRRLFSRLLCSLICLSAKWCLVSLSGTSHPSHRHSSSSCCSNWL